MFHVDDCINEGYSRRWKLENGKNKKGLTAYVILSAFTFSTQPCLCKQLFKISKIRVALGSKFKILNSAIPKYVVPSVRIMLNSVVEQHDGGSVQGTSDWCISSSHDSLQSNSTIYGPKALPFFLISTNQFVGAWYISPAIAFWVELKLR